MIFFSSKHALSQSSLDDKLTGKSVKAFLYDILNPCFPLSDRPSFHEEDPDRGRGV